MSNELCGQNRAVDTPLVYLIEDGYPAHLLYEFTEFLIDSTDDLSVEEIIAQNLPFGKLDTQVFQNKYPLWLKVNIASSVSIKDWTLAIQNNNDPNDFRTFHEKATFFYTREDQILSTHLSGYHTPLSRRDYPEIHSFSQVKFSIEAGQKITVYAKLKDRRDLFSVLEIRDPSFSLDTYHSRGQQGIVIGSGITFILSIYVFFFFLYTRESSFLYFLGMLICQFLHFGILDYRMYLIDWFFPEHPYLIEAVWIILTSGTFAFTFQFGRTFTRLKQLAPFWDRVVKWYIFYILIYTVARIIMYYSSFQYDILTSIATNLMFLAGLTIIVRLAFIKDEMVRYFVFGAMWLLLFSILGILWEMQIIPFFDLPNPWMVAQVGFMLIYALSLGRKFQMSEKARLEIEKVKEIDAIKSHFFTNISHEFRTPLALIMGPIGQAIDSIPASENIADETEIPIKGRYLKMMQRNTSRLQNLVNQIMDLSKLDQRKMPLHLESGDVMSFIRSIVFSFESAAESKHILYRTHFDQSSESAFFDRDKLEKILSNLISNAIKFSPENGEVSVNVGLDKKYIRFQISDTGAGMNTDEQKLIFDRFYQLGNTQSQGTGIGLSLVKELVTLYRGQISVDSTTDQGTTFKVSIPWTKHAFDEAEIVSGSFGNTPHTPKGLDHLTFPLYGDLSPLDKNLNTTDTSTLPVLLIVEDQPDLRRYISDQLYRSFQILLAKDGQEGLEIAQQKIPDLIISDIMMPRMNGIELCNKIKENVLTNHIPLILLTAKAGRESKIDGLIKGADDYITKPFDVKELKIRAENLVVQRKQLIEKFKTQLTVDPAHVPLDSMDQTFIKSVMEQIKLNMSDESFSVEKLAQEVGFSRSQLNRKLRATVDKTPNEMIREYRLKIAKNMLVQKSATVSEAAYSVGYSNLSYFSRSFKDAFGVSPSEVAVVNQ